MWHVLLPRTGLAPVSMSKCRPFCHTNTHNAIQLDHLILSLDGL